MNDILFESNIINLKELNLKCNFKNYEIFSKTSQKNYLERHRKLL